jgi:hypothetical protein
MRSALALAGLATMVMAAPLEMTNYQAYYGPYANYTPYSLQLLRRPPQRWVSA